MVTARRARCALALAFLALGAAPLRATFPGKNGRIVYTTHDNTIYFTDTGQFLSHQGLEYDFAPSFSPDGTKLAFIRQTALGDGRYDYRVMVVNVDGTGLHTVASNSYWGTRTFWFMHSTAWTADGSKVSFVVQGDATQRGIWTVGSGVGGGGLTRTVAATWVNSADGLDWSPVGRQLVYACSFRRNQFNHEILDLCVFDELTGIARQLPIDWPGRTSSLQDLNWTPDGERIVFLLSHTSNDQNLLVNRVDIFSVDATGGGIRKISDSGPPLCPRPTGTPGEFIADRTFAYFNPTPSPSGHSIIAYMWKNVPNRADCGNTNGGNPGGYTTWSEVGLYELGADGTPGALIRADGGVYNDWAPIPVKLRVDIDDGHGHPLEGLKVELHTAQGVLVDDSPFDSEGSYAFVNVPPGDYTVTATLIDNDYGSSPGPAFEIREAYERSPVDAVWISRQVTVPPGKNVVLHMPFDDSQPIVTNLEDPFELEYLDDMANLYFRLRQYVDWVRQELTIDTGPTVVVYTFSTYDLEYERELPDGFAGYRAPSAILLGTAESSYTNRDGLPGPGLVDSGPENSEWHEYTHHLYHHFVNGLTCAEPSKNHSGYANIDTCDSMKEGFAMFLPTLARQAIDGVSDSVYDGMLDLETNIQAWETRVARSDGNRYPAEDLAVSALFWDLVDGNQDSRSTWVVGEDHEHHAVELYDEEQRELAALWSQMVASAPVATVRDLRESFGTPEISLDLDGDVLPDIAPVDQVFLLHGFFPILGDQSQSFFPPHLSYHYDVAAANRAVPSAPRNADVGLSDHHGPDVDGIERDFLVRRNTPAAEGASLAVDVRDASGTPLSGAEIELSILYPGETTPRPITLRMAHGTGDLLHFELPPYFSYMLPPGAPLPACNPATDLRTDVTITARLNGYVSTDHPTFDGCTYLHAVESSTAPAALELTATFPEDSTAPLSTIVTTPTDALAAGGGTLGSWIVYFSCADPVVDGFASGCRRTEYRINSGPLVPYTRPIEIAGIGQYVVEFRSADSAANEETFRSVTLAIAPPPDSDGDGLSDPVEVQLGTNPNDADSDDDGLLDGDEVARGTNPLATDSDGDGLSDAAEVGLGTNPLAADTDGDGLSDAVETAPGFDPLDPDIDNDGALDGADSCRTAPNSFQRDTDADGVGDLCDNCPAASNSTQLDYDGDGAGDACDCSASPLLRTPAGPYVLASKSGSSTIELTWAAVVGADDYAVTRGGLAGLAVSDFGSCFGHTGRTVTTSDAQLPAPGTLFTYLVHGQSFACGVGSLGFGANETQRTNVDVQACAPAVVVDRTTVSETSIAGTVNGGHFNTHDRDDIAETLSEALSGGGNPANRYSLLEHRYVVDVAPGTVIELVLYAERSASTDGDDLRFEWSTNGTTFTPIQISVPTDYESKPVFGPLPATLNGPVTIRVIDSDRTPGHQFIDYVWIDRLVVRSISF